MCKHRHTHIHINMHTHTHVICLLPFQQVLDKCTLLKHYFTADFNFLLLTLGQFSSNGIIIPLIMKGTEPIEGRGIQQASTSLALPNPKYKLLQVHTLLLTICHHHLCFMLEWFGQLHQIILQCLLSPSFRGQTLILTLITLQHVPGWVLFFFSWHQCQ